MGQLETRCRPRHALAAAMYVLCTTQTTMCCVRHEHDAEGDKKCKKSNGQEIRLAGSD